MNLVEHVHYEIEELRGGRFVYDDRGLPLGYCHEGAATWLRRIHPDVSVDDLAQLGRHLRTMRRARNKIVARRKKIG